MWAVEEQRVDTAVVVYYTDDNNRQSAVWLCEALEVIANYVKSNVDELRFWPTYSVIKMSKQRKNYRKAKDTVLRSKHMAATIAAGVYYDCKDIQTKGVDWKADLVNQLKQTVGYQQKMSLLHELVGWLTDEKDGLFCTLFRSGYGDDCDDCAILGWYQNVKDARAYAGVSSLLVEWNDTKGRGWSSTVDVIHIQGFRYFNIPLIRPYDEIWFDGEHRGDGVACSAFFAGKTRVMSAKLYLNELNAEDISHMPYLSIVTERLAGLALEHDSKGAEETAKIIIGEVPEYESYKDLCAIVNHLLHYNDDCGEPLAKRSHV